MYQLVLQDYNNLAETRASIDTLTSILKKEKLPLVQPESTAEQVPFYCLQPSFQLQRKSEFTQGKQGIAVIARHITNTAMTQWAGLKLDSKVLNKFGLNNLDCIIGRDGYRVTDWLSAMVNAHVDVAKDPYVIILNINEVTYDTMCLLLRCGLGHTTFSFLAQPVLKTFASMKMAANGIYGITSKPTDSQIMQILINQHKDLFKVYANKALQNIDNTEGKLDKVDEIIHRFNYVTKALGGDRTTEQDMTLDSEGNITMGYVTESAIDSLTFDTKLLDSALKKYASKTVDTTVGDFYLDKMNAVLTQMLAIRAYNMLQNDAKTLGNLVQISQVDTKKFGNSYAKHRDFINSLLNFVDNDGGKFYVDNLDSKIEQSNLDLNAADKNAAILYYLKGTFLWNKLFTATGLSSRIMESQIVEATRGFYELFIEVMSQFFGRNDVVLTEGQMPISAYNRVYNTETAAVISANISNYLRAQVIQDNPYLHLDEQELNEMFFGDNTIANRLSNVKTYLRLNRDKAELRELVTEQGTIVNDFLNYLQEEQADGDTTLVSKITLRTPSMQNSGYTEDQLTAAFYTLWQCEDDTVKKFVRDLIRYGYYTSWDERGSNTFTHLIPHEVKKQIGYIQDITNLVNYWKNMTFDQARQLVKDESFGNIGLTIARNFADDDRIVKRVELNLSRFKDWPLVRKGLEVPIVALQRNRTQGAEFFSVSTPQGIKFYRLRGTVMTYDADGDPTIARLVYELSPRLGFTEGTFKIRELDKDGLEKSSYSFNDMKFEAVSEEEIASNTKTYSYTSKKYGDKQFWYQELDKQTIARNEIFDDRQPESPTDLTGLPEVNDLGDLDFNGAPDLNGLPSTTNTDVQPDFSESSAPVSIDIFRGLDNNSTDIKASAEDYLSSTNDVDTSTTDVSPDLDSPAPAASAFAGMFGESLKATQTANETLQSELSQLGYTEEQISEATQQFSQQNPNINTVDEANEAVRKFICNL